MLGTLALGARSGFADRAVARARAEEAATLYAAGQNESALRKVEEGISADADYLPTYDTALELWMARGEYKKVIEVFGQITLKFPTYARGWYGLAHAYRKLGKAEVAIWCFETYISQRPSDPDPYFGLGMTALDAGNKEKATVAFSRYVELENRPGQSGFVSAAVQELKGLGVTVNRRPVWKIAGIKPSASESEWATELAHSGRLMSALAVLQALPSVATKGNEGDKDAVLARAYQKQGDSASAVARSLRALAKRPHDLSMFEVLHDAALQTQAKPVAEYFARVLHEMGQ